jgi:hypothetical protein
MFTLLMYNHRKKFVTTRVINSKLLNVAVFSLNGYRHFPGVYVRQTLAVQCSLTAE